MKKLFFIFIFLLMAVKSNAQFYTTGSSPASVNWNQIKSEKFSIIYPVEAKSAAQRLANTLEISNLHTAKGINSNVKKPIKIVLHNQNVASNGYVVWAPRRMELVPTLPQRSYAQNYLDQLALHEYRHVAQIEKLNQGFTKGLSFLLGEMAVGATTGLLPLWFLEGDAVISETALSSTGRGREPSFNQGLKAIELEWDKRLRYDQIYLGTYRTAAPNHYEFGYQMVAYAQANYGNDFWGNTLDNVARRSFTFIPFYQGLKKQAAVSKVSLYNKTFDFLGEKWKQESMEIIPPTTLTVPTKYKSNFVSYRFPYQRSDGTIVALRTSIDDITKLVELNNGTEKTIKVVGIYTGSQLAVSDDYIAWEERRYDPRWEQRNYSIIKILDRSSKKVEILKRTERHFSPSISPDQERIAVQKVNPANRSTIEIYDIKSKFLVKDFQHPERELLTFNTWISNSEIAIVTVENKGKCIYVLNIDTGEWTKIFGHTYFNISNLEHNGGNLYFTFTKDGRQNIYQLNLSTKEVSRVTNTKTGADFANLSKDGKNLMFSEYTTKGYKIKILELQNANLVTLNEITKYNYAFADHLSAQSPLNIQDTLIEQKKFEVSEYPKAKHLFNAHSWLFPAYIDLDEASADITSLTRNVYPGFTVFSQNMLSTVTSSLSYYYKDGHHHIKPAISIRAIYPVITFDMLFGGPPDLVEINSTITNKPENLQKKQQYNLRITQPLNLSTGTYSSFLTPGIRFAYENVYFADSNSFRGDNLQENFEGISYYKGRSYTDMSLSFYLVSKRAYKDLNPRWGISAYASSYLPMQNKIYYDNNKVVSGILYLPGLIRNHSLVINGALENGRGVRLTPPRGVSSNELIIVENTYKYGFTYSMPILYPDLNIGPLAYFKRIHTNLFYERLDYYGYRLISGNYYMGDFSVESIGFDLAIETNFLRFFFPFTPTFRYAYRMPTNDFRVSFFITSSLSF